MLIYLTKINPSFSKYDCAVPISRTLNLDKWLVLSDNSANASFFQMTFLNLKKKSKYKISPKITFKLVLREIRLFFNSNTKNMNCYKYSNVIWMCQNVYRIQSQVIILPFVLGCMAVNTRFSVGDTNIVDYYGRVNYATEYCVHVTL